MYIFKKLMVARRARCGDCESMVVDLMFNMELTLTKSLEIQNPHLVILIWETSTNQAKDCTNRDLCHIAHDFVRNGFERRVVGSRKKLPALK